MSVRNKIASIQNRIERECLLVYTYNNKKNNKNYNSNKISQFKLAY